MMDASIATLRLQSQKLAQACFKRPDEAVAWLVASQAQDYAGAKWSLGLRVPGSTEAGVEQALAARTFVRSWILRGTLHFAAAADIRWLIALVGPRLIAGNARRYRELDLDEGALARGTDLLVRAVHDAGQAGRRELLAGLERYGLSTAGQRGVYLLQRASLEGLICQGPALRNQATFIPLDSFPLNPHNREEALAELARRYFESRGPATLPDFSWWSGLPVTEARAALELVRSQLVEETLDGRVYWSSGAPSGLVADPADAYLLPGFDEFLLAYKDRSASLEDPRYYRRTPLNGIMPATMVVAGRVLGTWKRTITRGSIVIDLDPFTPLTRSDRAVLLAAAHRYGEFLRMPATLAPAEADASG